MTASVNLSQQTGVFQSLISELGTIIDDAADEDHAGTWGLDGWIRTIHNLIDLQIRTYAAVAQLSISGPAILTAANSPAADDVCEYFDVDAVNYDRRYEVIDSFKRVGKPDVVVPKDKIQFEPQVLGAGVKRFSITVEDFAYAGFNFTGSVGFCALTAPAGAPCEGPPLSITVGL
ncbi:hypothetical protein BH09ACT7_BH09ACT7_56880 [soil metagenome]